MIYIDAKHNIYTTLLANTIKVDGRVDTSGYTVLKVTSASPKPVQQIHDSDELCAFWIRYWRNHG